MLDERKKHILRAIVDSYISTAEPVGSRTLEKKYNLGLSSATIRNEMSDLEELGYLNQPHTSAGRVPSVNAYRLYVDELMTQYSLTMEEIEVLRSVMEEKVDYLIDIFQDLTIKQVLEIVPAIAESEKDLIVKVGDVVISNLVHDLLDGEKEILEI